MSVARAQEPAQMRRRHLALLARAVGARGLHWRLAGPGESVLAVTGPRSGQQVMIVAMPTGAGWSYLWTGGGYADVTAVDHAAEAIAHLLT
ncbi:hypothetical protein BTM25_21070 [Actinomadura rubteroloni]|uniref:Uncharacterized protein n=2 Tax=Actinomadura TaxID=1988 RepID=A0A2P4URL9_9ACTN|nr:hypothetical protein BTM25_21070 [Actinomadura rubteroloni]